MADFDPFANQGGPVAWDPEHSSDAKKQAEELSRRLAADTNESGNEPSTYLNDSGDADRGDDNTEDRVDRIDGVDSSVEKRAGGSNPSFDDTAEVDGV